MRATRDVEFCQPIVEAAEAGCGRYDESRGNDVHIGLTGEGRERWGINVAHGWICPQQARIEGIGYAKESLEVRLDTHRRFRLDLRKRQSTGFGQVAHQLAGPTGYFNDS